VYVVVYGARNHGSKAFCTYLAEHGYSLIIIDSDQASLNSAEKYVHKDFENVNIIKMKMEDFDEAECLKVIKQLNKMGEIIRGLVVTKNVMLNEQNSKKFEGLNFDEIHQIMHDNNEMMVGLVNVLMKPIKKSGNGFIINLRNEKYQTEEDAIYWDLLYHCSSKFSTFFIDSVRKAESKILIEKINQSKTPKVHMVSVSVNYDNIKKEEEKKKL
jgi:NADP-dependent 3-hydroxy acid dehydrogenase YdfG